MRTRLLGPNWHSPPPFSLASKCGHATSCIPTATHCWCRDMLCAFAQCPVSPLLVSRYAVCIRTMPRKPKPLTPEEQGQPGVTTGATEDALKASPIDDPEEEKFLVEKLGVSGYLAYLGRRMGVRPPWILSETLLESRISEVHRRCFERNKSPEFINDFVAYRPYLALRAGWLADVGRESLVRRDKPNMVLKALASAPPASGGLQTQACA